MFFPCVITLLLTTFQAGAKTSLCADFYFAPPPPWQKAIVRTCGRTFDRAVCILYRPQLLFIRKLVFHYQLVHANINILIYM